MSNLNDNGYDFAFCPLLNEDFELDFEGVGDDADGMAGVSGFMRGLRYLVKLKEVGPILGLPKIDARFKGTAYSNQFGYSPDFLAFQPGTLALNAEINDKGKINKILTNIAIQGGGTLPHL